MREILEKLGKIDRRIIYLVLAIVMIVPLITVIKLPWIRSMPTTKQLFEAVENLRETKKALMVSVDFGPETSPETYPMLEAVVQHAFSRDIPVIGLALWNVGVGFGEEVLRRLGDKYGKEYGKDYIYLGFKFPASAVILGMGTSIKEVFPVDYYGTPLDSLHLGQSIKNYSGIGLIFSISAGTPGYGTWIVYANAKFGVPVGAGVTAIGAADAYPFLPTGQLTGLLAGMKGAAEYENLIESYGYTEPGTFKRATHLMPSLSGAITAIMIFVLFANFSYFGRRRER